jgi:hypothetical protein
MERKEQMKIENCSVLSFCCGSCGNLNYRLKFYRYRILGFVSLVEEVDEKGKSFGRFRMGNYGVTIFTMPIVYAGSII